MIKRPILVTSVFSLVIVFGLFSSFQFPVSFFPDISFPHIWVNIDYPKASPEEVERNVVNPLEADLAVLHGVKRINSSSRKDGGFISLQFELGRDADQIMRQIRDLINENRASLPGKVALSVTNYNMSNSFPVAELVLLGDRPKAELTKIAEEILRNRFLKIDGVAAVNVYGGQKLVVRIEAIQDRLLAFGLTLSEVSQALERQSPQELACGWVGDTAIYVMGQYHNLDDIASIVVGKQGSYSVLLRDVAHIEIGREDQERSFSFFDGKDNVSIFILKKKTGNNVFIVSELKKELDGIQQFVPEDVQLHITHDNSKSIQEMLQNLTQTAVQTVCFAILVVFLFLRRISVTLIVGLSIPVALYTSFLVMNFFHLTLNMVTSIGLIVSMGVVLDGAIVIAENIVRYRERGIKKDVAADIGGREVRSSVIASILTSICLFVPLLMFKSRLGIFGIIFEEFFFVIVISLFSSLAVALFLVPVLVAAFSTNRRAFCYSSFLEKGNFLISRFLEKLTTMYCAALDFALRHRLIAFLFVVLISLSAIKFTTIPLQANFPSPYTNNTFDLSVKLLTSTTVSQTKRVMVQLDEMVRRDIKGWSHINISGEGNQGRLAIIFPDDHPKEELQKVLSLLKRYEQEFPGTEISLQRDEEYSSQRGERIYFESLDYELALKAALDAKQVIKDHLPEVEEVSLEGGSDESRFEIIVDRHRASALGVSFSDIIQELRKRFGGESGELNISYYQNGSQYPLVLMMKDQMDQKLDDLNTLHLINNKKQPVAFLSVAKVEKNLGKRTEIRHENGLRSVVLNVRMPMGQDVNQTHSLIQKTIEENLVFNSQKISLRYGGDFYQMKDLLMNALGILILTIALIFGVMAAQYESLKNPFINLFTIPSVVIGAYILLFLTNTGLDYMGILGFLFLVGIVVNNGIILVDYISLSHKRGLTTKKACLQAGALRLRPILMTNITTIIGMILLASSSEMFLSFSLTIIGGLISSCVITLFLIPVLYSLFNKDHNKKNETS